MHHPDCQCELLAKNPLGQITLCQSCAQAHLRLHYISLRFETGALRQLAALLNEACALLDAAAARHHDTRVAGNGTSLH